MIRTGNPYFRVAIACGGTGGHLFPGLAVGERLLELGAEVDLLVSGKEVDRRAVFGERRFGLVTLPAVGFAPARPVSFLRGCWQAARVVRAEFARRPPDAVLAMGGFTSLPAVWGGRRVGAACMLHEANAVPGRATRWLARLAQEVFVFFPEARKRIAAPVVRVSGMPVRSTIRATAVATARSELGLLPEAPVLLVMGGSQGARAINELILQVLPRLRQALPQLQFVHFTGDADLERIRAALGRSGARARTEAFSDRVDLALSAAEAAVTRAGASSLAEIAALRVPALLIPYPHAADHHQLANARAFERSGAALMLEQATMRADALLGRVLSLLTQNALRNRIRRHLQLWHQPDAAAAIAEAILGAIQKLRAGSLPARSRAREKAPVAPTKEAPSPV